MANLLPLLRLMTPVWRRILPGLLLAVVTIGSSVALMMTSAWLISTAALHMGIASLGVAPTAVRMFGLLRALCRYGERLVHHDITFRLLARLRVWFYERIEPLSLLQRQSLHGGDLMARVVSDIDALQNLYLRVVSPPLVAAIVSAGVGIVFLWFDGRTALILVLFMLGTGTVLPLLAWWIGKQGGSQGVAASTEQTVCLVDAIQGLPDSLAFGYATEVQARLASKAAWLAHCERQMGRLDGVQSAASLLMVNLAAVCVLWVALGRVDGVVLATLTLGAIAAFEAVTPLALAGQNLGQELAAASRVFAVIDSAPDIPEPRRPRRIADAHPALSLAHVTFRYGAGERAVLADFSLHVAPGAHVLIVGESGAGKSSLINILLRLVEYEAGSVTIGGVDLRELAQEEVHRLMGVMTQRTHIFNTTIRENIRIGRTSASNAAIEAAAATAQIHSLIASLPQGYDTRTGEGGVLLSAGERQRIALARMVLKAAPIWLLDEITANLDPITAANVMRTILAAARDRTLILVTHQPEMVADHPFDQVIRFTLPGSTPCTDPDFHRAGGTGRRSPDVLPGASQAFPNRQAEYR